MLKGIPKGTTFILRVVEPLKAGFGKQIQLTSKCFLDTGYIWLLSLF